MSRNKIRGKTQKQIREEEKKFKNILNKIRVQCIETKKLYSKLFLSHFDDLIEAIDKYKKREIDRKQLIYIYEGVNNRILEVKKWLKGGER